LLNNGFPINFDGEKNSVPIEKIQLTRALLMLGIFQAYELEKMDGKIIPLDIEIQRGIIKEHLKNNVSEEKKSKLH
jgi:hypothetical protein